MRTWAPRGPLLLALAVSAVLLASVLLTVRTVGRARDGAARGLASGFSVAGREQLRRPERLDAAELQAFLDEQADEGLRYVATIDADGRVLAEAGTAHGRTTTPGLHAVGDRVRVVERPVAGGRRRPGDGGGRRAVAMVFEFEPLVANQLAADARWLFVAAIAASLVVVALAVWVGRGLRQRERLQVELERGKRLAALGEMSAVLAHELRNPLTSLKGHAQLLEEVLDAGPARTKAGRVVAESERLETLANDLLDFVKTGAVHRAACDPAALVRDAATEAGDGRVDVDATAAPARWDLDAARLRQALVNVMRNAVQASPDGARVDVTVATERDRLVIRVRDRGAGVPAGDEAAIFEPFHTRRVKGVGLGLAIARRVVELHGGTIEAGNHAEGGAEFRLTLPRSAA